ncbi:TRAP transporter small permease [Labrenzia sp. R4_1]|uniref:TRAP transporter small permease n=1 Tax=Labrenzia sp. R4_1 TaxID=2821106 RepID=UPI001ADD1921|nr:TRAP transporter small permease [Labrenzia sp. R4_1]MBO9423088.1 TRAP transporter small permease [Labrenzia sp. R4_1]
MTGTHGGGALLLSMNRGLGAVEDTLNIIAALMIFIVMLVTTFQIFCRLAGYPIPGFLEASEQAIAVFAFLGVAYAQRYGAHIRMDMLVGAAHGRMRWFLEAVATLLGMILIAVLIRHSWSFFYSSFEVGDVTYDYGIPTWPSKLLVPFAFSIWFLRLSQQFIGFLRLFIWPKADPVAVPVIKTAADHAQDEASSAGGGK